MTEASELEGPNPDRRAARLLQVREQLGLSQEEMGRRVGVSGRSWQDYEAKKAVPKVSVYESLQRMGFNPAWLLGDDTAPTRLDPRGIVPAAVVDEELVALPRYGVEAAAGNGASVVSEQLSEFLYFRRTWLRTELGVNPSRLAIITARGDSMAPTIRDGDLLIVDTSDRKWTRDGIYVIGVEDDLWVKRVDRRIDGSLVLSSDNPEHKHGTETIERAHVSTIRFIGRVVWSGGKR